MNTILNALNSVKNWFLASTTVPNWGLVAAGAVLVVAVLSHC